MAKYSLVRGWLECSFEDVDNVKKMIYEHWATASLYEVNEDAANLYRSGWTFPSSPINWTSLIFFGANVSETAVQFIFDCLAKIAKSSLEIDGHFHLDDEEGEAKRLWELRDGELVDIPR